MNRKENLEILALLYFYIYIVGKRDDNKKNIQKKKKNWGHIHYALTSIFIVLHCYGNRGFLTLTLFPLSILFFTRHFNDINLNIKLYTKTCWHKGGRCFLNLFIVFFFFCFKLFPYIKLIKFLLGFLLKQRKNCTICVFRSLIKSNYFHRVGICVFFDYVN